MKSKMRNQRGETNQRVKETQPRGPATNAAHISIVESGSWGRCGCTKFLRGLCAGLRARISDGMPSGEACPRAEKGDAAAANPENIDVIREAPLGVAPGEQLGLPRLGEHDPTECGVANSSTFGVLGLQGTGSRVASRGEQGAGVL